MMVMIRTTKVNIDVGALKPLKLKKQGRKNVRDMAIFVQLISSIVSKAQFQQ